MQAASPYYSLGIDIGGTFTDLVLYDEERGSYRSHKELTTPQDPTEGVIAGLRHLFEREQIPFAALRRVVHATTLFTNALIERKGALTGVITTEGFRDVLEIGRERKYELYDIFIELPTPLVRRSLRLEVPERMSPAGVVEIPLDCDALVGCAETLVDKGVQSIAIIFLHAYANPAQEQLARDVLEKRFPHMFVSISSDVAPQIREYERASTTVANAYIKPLASRYVGELNTRLKSLGIGADLFLMLSNGGITNTAEARRNPIQMLESGPAAGALIGAYFGMRSESRHVLAFDMGGTTAKLSVVEDGQPLVVYSFEAGRERRFIAGSGLPISISTVELIEIGAGGGSIAHVDELGLLKVGPHSAGAAPGPACYQRGGELPTVTDANLVLGYLNPEIFAGGTMRISPEAAMSALDRLARGAGLGMIETAWGVHNLINEMMAGAARVHISEHGRDPRRYALLTTGGGGPLHGCEVARKLGIGTVICPPSAGVASALGLLVAPTRIDRVRTVNRALAEVAMPQLEAHFQELEAEAKRIIAETGIDPATAVVSRLADMRYAGQGFELVVGLPAGPYASEAREAILTRFEADYRAIYTRTPPKGATELINIRISVEAPAGRADLRARPASAATIDNAQKGTRAAYFGALGGFAQATVYDRSLLGIGAVVSGPALVEEPESTLLLPPNCTAQVEANGNIIVTVG
jgi:N-methylhydantoinase A